MDFMKKKLFSQREIVTVALFAAVFAISAWISIPFAIPFTMQTLALFLAVLLLPAKVATSAIIVYTLLGAIGLPVFSGFVGGVAVLAGERGGYIIGFILAVAVSSFLSRRTSRPLALLLGLLCCYIFGSLWFHFIHGGSPAFVIATCVLPFVPFDILKLFLALLLSKRLGRFTKQ